MEWLRRVWYLLNRSRFERELQEEMDAHRAMTRAGDAPFGNALRLRDEAVDEWGWRWLDALIQDLRFALRLLWRSPAFAAAAIAVLSLGVGLNLAAFQLIDLVAVSSLPVRSPETLVKLHHRNPRGSGTSFSYPAFDFYRADRSSLAASMALVYGEVTLDGDEEHRVDAEFVTGNYFNELGATPIAGRLLDSRDDSASASTVAVLSEATWRARLGGDPSVVGKSLRVNDELFTIVGIASRMFVGVGDHTASMWFPIAQHRSVFPGSALVDDWKGAPVRFYARLRPDVTFSAAEAELNSAARALRALRPDDVSDGEQLVIRAAGRFVSFDEAGPMFALCTSLVALVLVAACMNLSLLVLSRTVSREREFAIRLAVGASRMRIVRQLLTEHLLLGVIGTATAFFVAAQSTRGVLWIINAPPGLVPHLNARIVAVAAVLAIVSSLVFGFGPAWQTLRPVSTRRLRLRSLLLGAQVAAATTLLIVSSLLVRGVTRVVRIPLGFDYQQTLTADPGLASHGVTPASAAAFWQSADARVRQIPGVTNTAITTLPPLGNRVSLNRERTVFYYVTPSYFDTLQIDVKRGRIFADGESSVALVSESLARRRWPDMDPIGQVYEGATIVGIVADARTVRLSEQAATECYLPIAAPEMANAVMVVRAETPSRAAAPIRTAMRDVDARLTPSVVRLRDSLNSRLEVPRRVAVIASAIGICALLLAVTGLAGMVAFTVSQRLREIGVRIALGARPAHVFGAIARPFTAPVACGALIGSVLAAGAATVLSGEMYGIGRLDALSHGGALMLFVIVAAAASLPSFRRALRVDPITTLRHE